MPVTFPLPLNVEVSENGRLITLLNPVIYADSDLNLTIEVPAGFVSDWNSTPRLLWRFLAPFEYPEAAVVHDWLYQNKIGRRKDADLIHYKALLALGCPPWKAYVAWTGLRVFGALYWKDTDDVEPQFN